MKVIALEEHYWDQELASQFKERGPEMRIPALQERLFDVDALRIKEMDEAGIDLQVLSHGAPATQRLDAQSAVPVARKVNDKLRETVKAIPAATKHSPCCPPPTRKPRPTSSSAR